MPCRPWRPLRASCAAQVGPHAPTCRGAWVPCAVPARNDVDPVQPSSSLSLATTTDGDE